jgi:hypothetical protein
VPENSGSFYQDMSQKASRIFFEVVQEEEDI